MSSKSPGQKRKQIIVLIVMLDEQEVPFQIDSKLTGKELINLVYQYLKLVESDYFGLEYIDSKGKKCWIDYDKAVSKQVDNNSKLMFCVKFYTPDPGQLEEEYTRYLYALQIKRDLTEGLLLCSDATASLLVSYILQAEIGDYADNINSQTNILKEKRFFPHQNEEHEAKILEYHKNHIGQSPADADLNLLDIARKVELYGIIMHPAKDHEGVQLNLAVAHMGILVFQNYTKINTFSWAKIRKLSFRRKKFLVKLHPENYGFYKDTVEFYFENRDDSKNFWKKCIENHSFFRCISTQRMPRQKSKLLTRGSSFRYYGRTQKELIENTRENFSKNRSFDRSYHSMRCISQLGSNGNTNQINGTQSLNRNLASRSTGALMIPANNLSSTLSSNDSAQNFHNYQNTSSSAHHLSYNPAQDINIKSGLLKKQGSIDKETVLKTMNDQQNDPTSVQSLNNYQNNNQQKNFHQQLRDNDSSTHGSRTIDSRFSRDKTLGLSDEDADVNNEDEDDDDDDDEDDDDEADDYEENLTNDDKKFKKADDKCTCKQHNDNEQSDSSILKNQFLNQTIPINKQQIIKNNTVKTIDADYSNSYRTPKFKPSSQISNHNSNYQHKLISLPIQQEQKLYSKQKNNSSDQATDNESTTAVVAAPALMTSTNPNKIYSRKEVITTYKEETKNTHLEEYHQTTTFYDTPAGSIEFLSSTSAPNQKLLVTSSSSKQNPHSEQIIHQPHYHEVNKSLNPIYAANGLSRSTPPMGTATKQLQQTLKTMKQKTTPLKSGVDDEDNNSKHDDEIDNDDEVLSKNDRCSLAARILYSNFQQKPIDSSSERVVRPSTLSKSLIIAKNEASIFGSNKPFIQKTRLYDNINNNLLKVSIDKYKQNAFDNEHFPAPPPIPQLEQPHQHDFANYQAMPAAIIQDYQEPIKSSLKSNILASNEKQNLNSSLILNIEDEFKRKKIPLVESYCIFKEFVMTERTYKKDLDLLTQAFRHFATKNNFDLNEIILFEQLYPKTLDPINEFHTEYIKILEQRLFYWTDKNNSANVEFQKIGDLLLNLNAILKNYRTYIIKYDDIICELDASSKKNKKFDSLYKDFESQKICYLPFSLFLLKPIQRLIHYKILIERLLIYYGVKHHDYQETYAAFLKIDEINNLITEKISAVENKQKLIELQRDLIGIENLNSARQTRFFIREGSLQKLSRKGYQQRMFFLFNDVLLYCARSSTPFLQFKVHGEYQLKNMQIEDGNSHINIPNSFTIYSSNRSLLVSAITQEEKTKWLQDLCEAIEKVKSSTDDNKQNYPSLKSNSSSDNNLDISGINHDDQNEQGDSNDQHIANVSVEFHQKQQPQQHRANTTMHVCWHRNTSVGYLDNHRSLVNQMSGYLLRKFKNSNGWQKLWVVFTNFCLFFYKTYQDEFPLASLPLLGYTITIPIETDNINKEYVFKLQFKNHVYFFRAESQYSFDRWIEVIESAAYKQCSINPNE